MTLTWDNGAGLVFSQSYAIDGDYMFTVDQRWPTTRAPVSLHPFARVRRDYQPVTAGYYILHEGPLGVLAGTLQDPS